MSKKTILALALLPLLTAGCAVGPDFETPKIDTPADWRIATPATAVANLPWWEVFKDKDLQILIQTGLEENKDIKIALARLEQATAAIHIATAAYLPSVDYSAGAHRSYGTQGPGTPRPHGFTLGGTVQWELDLWGRLRRLDESASAQYFATEASKNAVVLTLVSEIASGYFRLRLLDAQLALAQQTAQTRRRAYELAHNKFENGVGNLIDTRLFEAEMHSAQASISEFTRAIALQENALSVLLGRNPGAILRQRNAHAVTPDAYPTLPEIPAGIPSGLLQRRPDILAAEQRVRAANAQVGAAIAEYFPRVSLTGALGFINPSLAHLLENNSMGRQGGGTLLGPLFNGGAIHHNVRRTKAATREAVLTYENVALNAFREVNDALATLQSARQRITHLEKQTAALREATEKTRQAYESGTVSFLPVLDADRNLFNAQLLLLDTRTQELDATVKLYKALGGGWSTDGTAPLVDTSGKAALPPPTAR
ncbi:MAG: efflux transporter outer membrane subunit [Puniceicoccales bacterium]|jgi:multidrug efflux system outer membrane protein|nr:efflux transporter outer membrane subunit [Puniceicoccales bacterium]